MGREHTGVAENASRGGTGVVFAEDVAIDFLQRHDLTRLVRAHQCVEEGWERTLFPMSMRGRLR